MEHWGIAFVGHHIRIFGYGTLSGARLDHPRFASPQPKEAKLHDPIYIVGAANTSVEGKKITSLDHFKYNEHVDNIKFK